MLDTFRQRFDAPGEKCQLEMQVQGRFRKLPEGRLFMGAEISKRMDLGLLTKGLSNRYQHPFLFSLPLLPFFSPFHCSLAIHAMVNHDYSLLNTNIIIIILINIIIIIIITTINSILQLTRAANPYLHHSFGDRANFELPHITGPMWSALDRLCITPPSGDPPVACCYTSTLTPSSIYHPTPPLVTPCGLLL